MAGLRPHAAVPRALQILSRERPPRLLRLRPAQHPKAPTNSPQLIPSHRLRPLPLPHVDGLPPDAESTNDIPPDEIPYLKKAFDGLKLPFADFLREKKPTWVIVDFAHYWLPHIAAEFGIPCAYFSIIPASSLAFFGPSSLLLDGNPRRAVEGYTAPPEWIPSSSSSFDSSIAYRLHEARWMVEAHFKNASGVSDAHRLGVVLDGCKLVAVRTVTELESDWLRLLAESIYKKPVVPVGLLPPAPQLVCDDKTATSADMVTGWLDAQSPGTVVYVAFGSEAVMAGELVQELALGLELSNAPFLWAYRKPSELPEGFEDRVRGRGLVAAGWVPQLGVLAHRSVGAFFTHCGASSVIEALRFGLPLIMLPLIVDQGLIARAMAEKYKVGWRCRGTRRTMGRSRARGWRR
uniref:Glycosyltransferase n=1 Tax=Ananas comosus var. bracteatus TaxID=296719 RepID=A0A6V7NIR4_ANACO|nr:unnamed protein product [Ananas comosus var. bracteatus]